MLSTVINDLQQRLKINNIGGLNERNTDRNFIAPILEELGWNLSNFEDVLMDYSIKDLEQGSDIYYGLFDTGTPILLIEVRPLYSDLSNTQAFSHVFKTAKASPAKYLAVCNGVDWVIYNTDKTDDTALILKFSIIDSNVEDKLSLLSKSSIKSCLIDRYVDENPQNLSVKLVETKSRGYKVTDETHANINRLKNRIMNSRDVKDQEITTSLIVETTMRVLLESIEFFNSNEIANEFILKKRIEETFKKRFRAG